MPDRYRYPKVTLSSVSTEKIQEIPAILTT